MHDAHEIDAHYSLPIGERTFPACDTTNQDSGVVAQHVHCPILAESLLRQVVSSSAGASMSLSTTFMPAATKVAAIPRPMPLAAPVTTATLPLNSFIRPSRKRFPIVQLAKPASSQIYQRSMFRDSLFFPRGPGYNECRLGTIDPRFPDFPRGKRRIYEPD